MLHRGALIRNEEEQIFQRGHFPFFIHTCDTPEVRFISIILKSLHSPSALMPIWFTVRIHVLCLICSAEIYIIVVLCPRIYLHRKNPSHDNVEVVKQQDEYSLCLHNRSRKKYKFLQRFWASSDSFDCIWRISVAGKK